MTRTNKYLHFVTLQSLVNWSVAHLLNSDIGFTKHYPFVKIGDVIRRNTTLVSIEDKTLYKQITLKTNGGGAVLRDKKRGKDIGTKKQYLAKEGQFIMSKIDARNGAFGVVSNELDNAIVTGDFPLFDVDTKRINPVYLYLLSATKPFVQYAQSCSRGTTNRQRIDIDAFLSLQIPLPSLEEQNKIVTAYNTTITQADDLSQQAGDINDQIEEYLKDSLGIEKSNEMEDTNSNGFLHFVKYKDIDKWGYDFILKNSKSLSSTKYTTKKICQLCDLSSGGTPSRSRKEYYGGDIPWIKTGELQNEVLFDTEEKLTLLGLNNSSAKLYPKNSLVVAMYGATIGKTAKLGVEATTNQACAVLFNIDNNQIQTDYLWLYLQSQTDKLKSMAYGGAQPNINAGIVANYEVPIPPADIQNEIVNHITALRAEQKNLQQQASDLRQQAQLQFEQTIFN